MEPSSSSKTLFENYFLSTRRSHASCFVSWVCISLIVFSLLLLSNSFSFRVVTPFFQSFNTFVGSNNDKFVDNSSVISSSVNEDGSLSVGVVLEKKPQLGNLVDNAQNRSFESSHFDDDGKNRSFESAYEGNCKTHLVNFVGDDKNRGFGKTQLLDFDSSGGDCKVEGSGIEGGLGILKRNGGVSELEKCDLFDGKWVKDESKPYYAGGSCPYIDRDFDCHRNGRPDDGFVKWRWKPNGCDIPSLNATDFLERLRGKKLVFVGDSLNRNMWESLVCILWQSIENKTRVYETSGKSEFKKKGFYAFQFEDYNCSVDFVGSPFLVREWSFLHKNASIETLRLDLMDQTTSMYHDADVIIFNTGHWWTHEKTSRGEDYYQEGDRLHRRLKVLEAYKRALRTWASWVDKNIDSNKTQVLFRGYSVTHFRGGRWNSGGQCHKEMEPIYNTAYLQKYPSKMRAFEHILQEMTTPVIYLNISRLTAYRKDGHPSIYRTEHKTEEHLTAEHSQDCSHWCLPGVPDTWNELLYASLLKAGRGSWRM